jgi:outer membrane lipoprotein SlyB
MDRPDREPGALRIDPGHCFGFRLLGIFKVGTSLQKGLNLMRRVTSLALLVILAGCAQSYQPVVDTRGVDTARYQQDLFECRQYAERVSPVGQAATGGLLGAAGGAALGAIVGAFSGGAGTGAAIGAATGGAVGAGAGGVTGVSEQQRIIDNCLRGRGYNVLNN